MPGMNLAIERTAPYRCFVISPIGDPDKSPQRRAFADRILKQLIRPAAERASRDVATHRAIFVHRGEQIWRPGTVMSKVIDRIRSDDLLVAVLFEDNANVYYELGVAETLGRPVIYLHHKDYLAPFDIAGLHRIEFTDKDLEQAGHSGVVAELAACMIQLLDSKQGISFVAPFEGKVMAPPARVLPRDRFSQIDFVAWSALMLDAPTELWLAGTSLWELFRPTNTRFHALKVGDDGSHQSDGSGFHISSIIRALYNSGRTINIMTMDEASPALAMMLKDDNPDGARAASMGERVAAEIVDTHIAIKNMIDGIFSGSGQAQVAKAGALRVTKIANRPLASRVTLTDEKAYITPIFYSLTSINSGPSFEAYPKSIYEKTNSSADADNAYHLYRQVRDDMTMHQMENGYYGIVDDQRVTVPAQSRPNNRRFRLPLLRSALAIRR